jgi:hypothetical protein
MISKKVTRYYAECGKGYWGKSAAINHELDCKCWGNVKNKTCKTCTHKFTIPFESDTGEGANYACSNSLVDEHSGAPNGINYISVNCGHHRKINKVESIK